MQGGCLVALCVDAELSRDGLPYLLGYQSTHLAQRCRAAAGCAATRTQGP